jgi:rRNA biogenesis protein RRP5
MAWFNLENSFGLEEDADNCLKEALKCNDEFKVYSQVGSVYDSNPENEEKAEKIYKTMARKFCKEPEAWLMLGKHYFTKKDKNLKEARFTLQRALQSLEKKNHIATSAKFGQYEFQFGESERGKQIFENIISNFPKRTDQWNVYIDLVIKNKEIDFARDLFERMVGLQLKPAKTKFMFKKYMQFEQNQNGDDKQIRLNNVRKKAAEYLETLGIKLEDEDDEIMENLDDFE